MEFKLPQLGEGVYEAELVKWLVAAGDSVRPGQGLMEVLTDKATMEVPAAFAGAVSGLHQGILNYVLNQKSMTGAIRVERGLAVRWPGFGLDGLRVDDVAERRARPEIIHWAGLKRSRLRQMAGWELLVFFEDEYYKRIPGARMRRAVTAGQDAATQWVHRVGKLLQRGVRKYLRRT